VPEFPRLFHARLQGAKLGSFELFWDMTAPEPLLAGQLRTRESVPFWDVWTSFRPSALEGKGRAPGAGGSDVVIDNFGSGPLCNLQRHCGPPRRLKS